MIAFKLRSLRLFKCWEIVSAPHVFLICLFSDVMNVGTNVGMNVGINLGTVSQLFLVGTTDNKTFGAIQQYSSALLTSAAVRLINVKV